MGTFSLAWFCSVEEDGRGVTSSGIFTDTEISPFRALIQQINLQTAPAKHDALDLNSRYKAS